MEKLIENVKKELTEIGNKGLTAANLETASKLADMLKDLQEAGMEGGKYMDSYMGGMSNMGRERPRGLIAYGNDGYNTPYMDNGYGRGYMDGGYNRGYNGMDSRMRDHVERIREGAEMYEYGRERYQHGGSNDRMVDGLEKLMYAVCMFIESTMDFAQSPQEKEVIRKHIQKIRNI